MAFLRQLPARSRIRLAASHIRSGKMVELLAGLARAGVDIDVAAAACCRPRAADRRTGAGPSAGKNAPHLASRWSPYAPQIHPGRSRQPALDGFRQF